MKPVEPIPIVKLNDTLLDLLAALRPPIAWEAVHGIAPRRRVTNEKSSAKAR